MLWPPSILRCGTACRRSHYQPGGEVRCERGETRCNESMMAGSDAPSHANTLEKEYDLPAIKR